MTDLDRSILKNGLVVGELDRAYLDVAAAPIGAQMQLAEIVVKGSLEGELVYLGRTIRVLRIEEAIGLEIGTAGPRGPLWKQVTVAVLTVAPPQTVYTFGVPMPPGWRLREVAMTSMGRYTAVLYRNKVNPFDQNYAAFGSEAATPEEALQKAITAAGWWKEPAS